MSEKQHVDPKTLSHLTVRQRQNLQRWETLQDTLNRGDFDAMDQFFHPEFRYSNPSRPDLGSYQQWKVSPMELYRRFPPSHYTTLDATAKGDDEIWVHCHHHGFHKGGHYMGIEPAGREINVLWFSIVKFSGDKIIHIYSIADVLGMLIQVGVIDPKVMPVDPYK